MDSSGFSGWNLNVYENFDLKFDEMSHPSALGSNMIIDSGHLNSVGMMQDTPLPDLVDPTISM